MGGKSDFFLSQYSIILWVGLISNLLFPQKKSDKREVEYLSKAQALKIPSRATKYNALTFKGSRDQQEATGVILSKMVSLLTSGPSTWGGVCQTGRNQSPINIQLGTVIVNNYPPFDFNEDYLSKQKFSAKNNGHTIYVALDDDSIEPAIYGGGLKDKFRFEQLHFHWESEHEFEGKRADLEMHVVHFNSKYGSFAEASTKADGIAVLAVIFDEKNETDHRIENFFEYILHAVQSQEHHSYAPPSNNLLPGNDEEINSLHFALRDLLPKHVSRFFRYEGSLTTPDCAEVVQWTVFINRLPVSSKTLRAFRTLHDHDGNTLLQNFRPPQKLNGREVYIQIKNYENQPKYECEGLTGSGTILKPLLTLYASFCFLFIISRIH